MKYEINRSDLQTLKEIVKNIEPKKESSRDRAIKAMNGDSGKVKIARFISYKLRDMDLGSIKTKFLCFIVSLLLSIKYEQVKKEVEWCQDMKILQSYRKSQGK